MQFSKKVHNALIRVLIALVSSIIFYALVLIYGNVEWIKYVFAVSLFSTLILAVFWLESAEKEKDTSQCKLK